MYEKLKKYFPSLISSEVHSAELSKDYQWYITNENNFIGIKKSEMNKRDESILSTFLTPYYSTLPLPTDLEKVWMERIREGSQEVKAEEKFRFIYFSYSENLIKPKTFKKAIKPFFTNTIPIIWESENSGVLIEQKGRELQDSLSYEQIVDTFMSELYVKVSFYIGPYIHDFKNIADDYATCIETAKIATQFTSKPVVTYGDAIPFLLIDQMPFNQRKQISQLILKELENDEEMIRTIKTFILCNLNTSLTAKRLYMHRNSLQYRIDKFIKVTGIDIRKFEEAITVYIALLATMHNS